MPLAKSKSCTDQTSDGDDIERLSHHWPVIADKDIKVPSDAIAACQSEIDAAERSGRRDDLPRLHDQVARAYEAAGEYELMLHHYKISADGGYPPGMARYARLPQLARFMFFFWGGAFRCSAIPPLTAWLSWRTP
jgi:hypothetical protein